MKVINKSKEDLVGKEVSFEIKNPNWAHAIKMKGRVKSVQNRFNGFLCIEKGSISEDEFLIRVESIL